MGNAIEAFVGGEDEILGAEAFEDFGFGFFIEVLVREFFGDTLVKFIGICD